MTGQNLVDKYKLYTANTTDQSDAEILDLLISKWRIVLNDSNWEWLRKEKTGTVATDGTITVPTDFDEFMLNWSDDATFQEPTAKAVIINSNNPYYIYPKGHRNTQFSTNFCWYDTIDTKIKFTASANNASQPYAFDYKYIPTDFTLTTSPTMPANFDVMLVFSALLDEEVIQKSEQARDRSKQNFALYQQYLTDLRRKNLRLTFSN